jgi:hypothetical protein
MTQCPQLFSVMLFKFDGGLLCTVEMGLETFFGTSHISA